MGFDYKAENAGRDRDAGRTPAADRRGRQDETTAMRTWIATVAALWLTAAAHAVPSVTVNQMGMVAPNLRGYTLTADSNAAGDVNSFIFDVTGNPHQVWEAGVGPQTIFTDDQTGAFDAAWEPWDTRLLIATTDALVTGPSFPVRSESNDGSNPTGLTLPGTAGVGNLSVSGLAYTSPAPSLTFVQVIVPVGNTVEVDGSFIAETSPGTLEQATIDETLAGVALLPGDANADGTVSLLDLNTLGANFGGPGTWLQGDFTFDGNISLLDLNALGTNFGQSLAPSAPAVPEPTSVALLSLGATAMLRRKTA